MIKGIVDRDLGAFRGAYAAAYAFCLVNDMKLLQLAVNSVNRAYLGAHMTADTLVINLGLGTGRYKISDRVRRALCGAETADLAFIIVYLRKEVLDLDGIIRTCLYAEAAGYTSILAVLFSYRALVL